jgi:serine/threonine protein kinase
MLLLEIVGRSGVSDRRRTSLQNIFDIVDVKQGTFSLVYVCTFRGQASNEAIDASLFAVKTLRDKYLENEELVKKFYREAETWVKLGSNANVVRADYVLEIDEMPHIFMEYVAGGNLRALMKKGHISLSQSLDLAIQFCDGMIHANNKDLRQGEKGIVHRDIKPENIMLTKDLTLKVTDFGLVKALDEVVTGFAGTKEYASPEQFSGGIIDSRSDIYSFGIVLYEMSTGQRPFKGPHFEQYSHQHRNLKPPLPTKLNSEVPRESERIILKCLEKKPKNRYQRFEDLKAELTAVYQMFFGKRPERRTAEHPPFPISSSTLMGISLSSLGKTAEAFQWLEQAIKENPRNVLAWHYKGETSDKIGTHVGAVACFDEALKIDPMYAPTWSAKADALANLERFEEAIECYDKANSLKPMLHNHEFWANKGLAFARLSRYNEAIECFNKSIEIHPRAAKAWFGKGYVSDKLNRLQEAIEYYDKAIEIDPRNSTAWCNKGKVLGRMGRLPEVIQCYEKGLEINPRDADGWITLGYTFAALNRLREAIRCFDRAIAINPHDEKAKRLKNRAQAEV